MELTRSEKKRERLLDKLKAKQEKAEAIKQEQQKLKLEIKENENLCFIEISKSYNLSSDQLSNVLSSFFKVQDNPAGNTIPVQAVHAEVGTVTTKTKIVKEKEENEEID